MDFSFSRKNLASDLGTAVTMAIVAIPDAIASALLAGVNPTHGFNALMVGTPDGESCVEEEFFTGSRHHIAYRGINDIMKTI